jgi:hypothetical protein
MRRAVITALCLLIALCVVSSAGAKVRITKIYYNSPGKDNGSDESLNGEWVMIKNISAKAKTLKNGWKLRDAQGHVYRFPTLKMPAGSRWKIHTGSGFDSFPPPGKPGDLYYGLGFYIWNNDEDTATLKDGNGDVVDRCHYDNASANYKRC